MERKFAGLQAVDKRCSVAVTGGINRPPMERTRGTVKLYQRGARVGCANWDLRLMKRRLAARRTETSLRRSAFATLDGMGAVGEGAHARMNRWWWSTLQRGPHCWRECLRARRFTLLDDWLDAVWLPFRLQPKVGPTDLQSLLPLRLRVMLEVDAEEVAGGDEADDGHGPAHGALIDSCGCSARRGSRRCRRGWPSPGRIAIARGRRG